MATGAVPVNQEKVFGGCTVLLLSLSWEFDLQDRANLVGGVIWRAFDLAFVASVVLIVVTRLLVLFQVRLALALVALHGCVWLGVVLNRLGLVVGI